MGETDMSIECIAVGKSHGYILLKKATDGDTGMPNRKLMKHLSSCHSIEELPS